MAQPTPYSRQYNFTNFQAVEPGTPLPASELDLELSSAKSTIDQILNNLKLIQRDDTALANNSVGLDQLKDEIFIGINAPVVWATGRPFVVNDTVVVGAVFYRCLISHTTSASFSTDLAAGDWTIVADFNTAVVDVGAAIHASGAKSTPVDQDEFGIANSGSLYTVGKVTWANLKATLFAAWGPLISTGTGKATPIDADAIAIMDSAASNVTKVTTWAQVKTTLFAAWGALIAAGTGKTVPIGADSIVIADSASSNATKKVTLTNLFGAWGPLIAAGTAKTTPVDGDMLNLADSAASNAIKTVTFTQAWTNYLKGKADALYQPLKAILTSLGGLTIASGDILYGSGAATLANLAKGSDGTFLSLASGIPSWVAAPSAGQPIPSSSTLAVGTLSIMVNNSGSTVANAGTVAGTGLTQGGGGGVFATGSAATGTWTNRNGTSVPSSSAGLFSRTA